MTIYIYRKKKGLERKKIEEETDRWGPKGSKGSVPSNSGHGRRELGVWITDNVKDVKSNKNTHK